MFVKERGRDSWVGLFSGDGYGVVGWGRLRGCLEKLNELI